MKKLTFTLLITLAACLFSVPCNAKGKAKHVVFIGLDGWGAYSVPKADIPHIKQLMADGSYTLEKRTVLPSPAPSTGQACLWGQVLNCMDIRNGAPRLPNSRHAY